MNTRVFLDTEYAYEGMNETSGRPNLDTQLCEVLQIGAVRIDMESGQVLGRFTTLVAPVRFLPVPEFFFALTGISRKELESQAIPSFTDAISALSQFVGNSEPIWVFKGDWKVLSRCAQEIHGMPPPFQPFELVEPKLVEYGLTPEAFHEKHLEYCSGNLGIFLGIEKSSSQEDKKAHDATYDAESMAKAVWFLENQVKRP